jgi:hypothetical protein
MKPPKMVVSAHVASSMAALGAAALDHSASTVASLSLAATPGSVQLQLPPSQVVEVSLPPGCGWTCVKVPLV